MVENEKGGPPIGGPPFFIRVRFLQTLCSSATYLFNHTLPIV